MRKLHIALGTADINASVADYSARLGCAPEVVVPNEYALWRTDTVNFSVRKVPAGESGQLRHLGWEDAACGGYRTDTDVNGILWEHFSAEQQASEIRDIWPDAT
ncbi:MAG: hypothetical protein FD165_2486 [Gammaproteobacteria bacterium]|nr:MAG: hypothetical protein FD165_2486 [Gammaproteobacteria bacterium]TND02927.1 MAG: hypothetical protein FD120_1996 [Gammaproteobacteria bacterium]